VPGNEPVFARVIFESLAMRYAAALANLEKNARPQAHRYHHAGGANRNKLLVQLTEKRTGLPVEIGQTESTTIGNLAGAVGCERSEMASPSAQEAIRQWAARLCGL